MASSNQLFIILFIAATLAPSISAVEYVVGDETGWTMKFDYQAWAQGKKFHVGDKLVFKYPVGAHNVLKVNGTGFQECVAPADSVPFMTGNDVIPLTTSGRKWYICGVSQHCAEGNQKLFITVLDEVASPSSSPSPSLPPSASPPEKPSSATMTSASRFGFVVPIMGVLGVFLA